MLQMKKCKRCGYFNEIDMYRCDKCGHVLIDLEFVSVPSPGNSWPGISMQTTRRLTKKGSLKLITAIVSVGLLLFILLMLFPKIFAQSPLKPLILPSGLGVIQASNGENIGVNDGSFAPFDIGPQRRDSNLKQEAAQALRSNDPQQALSLWNQCLNGPDTNDAEVKIYLENQKALAFGHVTLIVGLDFQQPFPDLTSQRALQGAYIAQKEFNGQHPNLKLRLLLANTGGEPDYVRPVVRQILQIAGRDATVVGILGWETSPRTADVLNTLQQARATIPMLSESAAAKSLTGISPYFFRIVPPSSRTAQAAVLIAKNKLHATQAIVFEDPKSLYSQNFSQDFEQQFTQTNQVLSEIHFTAGKTTKADFSVLLRRALMNVNTSHIVIFFAGVYNYDVEQFQDALVDYPTLPVITGETGYVAHNKSVADRWYVVSVAFHDEWAAMMGKDASFFQEYRNEFDPSNQYPGAYDYALPNGVAIVSYDAAKILSHGIDIALSKKGTTAITPQDLEDALSQITGTQAWQGVSGWIDFGPDHDPINKALVVVKVVKFDTNIYFQMVCVQGHFSPNSDNSPWHCPT